MTKEEAENKAGEYLRTVVRLPEGDEIVVIRDATLVKKYGYIVFYDSKMYLETESIQHALAGNGPVVVENRGGITMLGSANSSEVEIAEYERNKRAIPL